MQRYGSVIEVKQEKLNKYKELHTAVWPEVLTMIAGCHIRYYSIYLRHFPDGKYYLFSYFEYHGNDFDGDMAKMTADPNTQKWWNVCKPCQEPFVDLGQGQWWAEMEEVFHCD
jgi:L-rhamnose mutarotase